MTLSNPRIFSSQFAVRMGVATLVTFFICLSLDLGSGSVIAGFASAAAYFLFPLYAVALLIVAGVVAFIAYLIGRLVGTTVAAVVLACLMMALVVPSYIDSQPMARLRRLVWEDAPDSLQIRFHEKKTSFNDGSTHTFIMEADSKTIAELCRAASLSGIPDTSQHRPLIYLPRYFSPNPVFQPDTVYYHGGHIELAHTPSEGRAFLVWFPFEVSPLATKGGSAR